MPVRRDPLLELLGQPLPVWQLASRQGRLTADALVDFARTLDGGDPAWISRADESDLRGQFRELDRRASSAGGRESLPLFGIPFAVKDNIQVAGYATTAACRARQHLATEDAFVVARLREAGAIVLGTTNLDQFATGLVGTRSPYGVVPSCFNSELIGGGSSSGSASVVARGLVPFALGTDTAGSGRVPAAFQNIVGYKPTRGRFSTRGVLPACRTLDCVSLFALTVEDCRAIAEVIGLFDHLDPSSRRAPSSCPPISSAPTGRQPRLGLPTPLEFFGDRLAQSAFEATLEVLDQAGFAFLQVDFSAFSELAQLLYGGPWVTERLLVVGSLLDQAPHLVDPTVRKILEAARGRTAEQVFQAEYERARLAQEIHKQLETVDALLVPTTPTTYRISEVLAEPIETNSRLGTYTNFTNLADLAGIALPGRFRADGLPAGITLLGPAWSEDRLTALAQTMESLLDQRPGGPALPPLIAPLDLRQQGSSPPPARHDGATGYRSGGAAETVDLVVVGAHLRGMPLNHQLVERAAQFIEETTTAPQYRLFALPGTTPTKPGLLRAPGGRPIVVEIWRLPVRAFGDFVARVPAPLGIGQIELCDGRWLSGFICEPWGLEGATEITSHGGFREYLAARS